MCSGFFKHVFTNHIYLIFMYKEDLALNNQQSLTYHKTQQNQTTLSMLPFGIKLIFLSY